MRVLHSQRLDFSYLTCTAMTPCLSFTKPSRSVAKASRSGMTPLSEMLFSIAFPPEHRITPDKLALKLASAPLISV